MALPTVAFGTATLTGMAANIESATVTIGGTIVVIGWMITGILWLLAAGNPSKITVAKGALIACVVGTIVVVLAGTASSIESVINNALGIT